MNKLLRIVLVLGIIFALVLSPSCDTKKIKDYYANENVYISATGTVSHITYNEEGGSLHIGFTDLSSQFDDNTFQIVGQNYNIVIERGIEEKLKIGDTITFITAPKYFGDGYQMPIVEIVINDETLLAFDEGFANFQTYLNDKKMM